LQAGIGTVREALRRVPRAGRVCFVIAFVNAAIWGIVVPPFQVPDELAHFAYAQYLAETGRLPPHGRGAEYSPQENTALEHLFFFSEHGHRNMRGLLTSAEDRGLRVALAKDPSPVGQGGSTSATSQPPLYYALEAVPYWLSPSQDILVRLALMRLLSALMAAGTVLAVFLFLRELLPGHPWSWTVGALGVAFQPTFDDIAAGVQGDNLLFLVAALSFLILLRSFRRGLTTRRAVAIGMITAAGVLAKLAFIALVPGIAIALLILTWRALPDGRRAALARLATTVGVVAVPFGLYALLNVVLWHRGGPLAGGIAGVTNSRLPAGHAVTLDQTLNYTWQLYLPRPWFLHPSYFSGYPLWHTWFDGSVGRFGYFEYGFPGWVYTDGRYLVYGLVGLAVAGVIQVRHRIRPMLPIFICFGVMAIGLLGAIGYAGIRYRLSSGYQFEQARYLFPLLALYGVFLALAARGAGRRWGPAVGAALVLLAMAHGLFAETLTISRYYG
jgi:4-amino-4-deoxy-L-arabinose transferase-like glycosyltransferase